MKTWGVFFLQKEEGFSHHENHHDVGNIYIYDTIVYTIFWQWRFQILYWFLPSQSWCSRVSLHGP